MNKTKDENMISGLILKELESEVAATRKCLERIPANLFDWKPQEGSMRMGDLAYVVSDIPNWLSQIIEDSEIDFANYKNVKPQTTEELIGHFDESLDKARKSMAKMTDSELDQMFYLKDHGKELMASPKGETLAGSINHLIHHRGQLTVYMRLNKIEIPSIYGPSGDDRSWG